MLIVWIGKIIKIGYTITSQNTMLDFYLEEQRIGIIEMYWDRKTKKTNAVYCHPLLHDKIKYTYYENSIHRNLTTKILGCQIKYLRKINYTMVATKIDPLLAEFMQGRRGNVSQRHYFLPMMQNNRKKWNKIWSKILA